MPQLQPGEYTKQSAADLLGWNSKTDLPQPGTARMFYNAFDNTIHVIDSAGNELFSASGGAVNSVNGQVGVVVITADQLGAVVLAPIADQIITGAHKFILSNPSAAVGIGTLTPISPLQVIGAITSDSLVIRGSSSGSALITTLAAAGSPTLTLPTTSGTIALTSQLPIGINFSDNETPTGGINSVNRVFTLAHSPSPAASLQLFRDGVLQQAGGGDYTLSGNTITFTVAGTPQGGAIPDILLCSYRY